MSDNHQKQVSLAGAAAGKRNKKSNNSPQKSGKKSGVIIALALVVVVVLLVALLTRDKEQGPSLSARETIQYTVTEDSLASKVSYFALGVLGENATDRMDMTAVMCYDRKADKITVMQLPVATYLGDTEEFAVSTLGDVWGKPKAIVWCDTCRRKVTDEEIEDKEHVECGSKITTRDGSAFTDYCKVFNLQYGLPIDNYLVIPREGLADLIDEVGGVDVELDSGFSVDGERYEKGVQTLSGSAAMYYAIEYKYNGRPDSDRERLLRQRQVFVGLLDRLSQYKESELYNADASVSDILSGVILGSDPIRYDTTSFGKARLMGVSENRAEGVKYIAAMAAFIHDIGRVDVEDITYCTLPGVSLKRGTGYVYSVNKGQTIDLINEYMNPYGLTIDDTTVTVTQINKNQSDADTAVVTFDELLVQASDEE